MSCYKNKQLEIFHEKCSQLLLELKNINIQTVSYFDNLLSAQDYLNQIKPFASAWDELVQDYNRLGDERNSTDIALYSALISIFYHTKTEALRTINRYAIAEMTNGYHFVGTMDINQYVRLTDACYMDYQRAINEATGLTISLPEGRYDIFVFVDNYRNSIAYIVPTGTHPKDEVFNENEWNYLGYTDYDSGTLGVMPYENYKVDKTLADRWDAYWDWLCDKLYIQEKIIHYRLHRMIPESQWNEIPFRNHIPFVHARFLKTLHQGKFAMIGTRYGDVPAPVYGKDNCIAIIFDTDMLEDVDGDE